MPDDERGARIGANEAIFRALNEEIEALNRPIAEISDEKLHLVCECGSIDCAQPIAVPVPRYEKVRADATLFFVVPGHELLDVESVVERTDAYFVVRKRAGAAAQLAEETDPRSG